MNNITRLEKIIQELKYRANRTEPDRPAELSRSIYLDRKGRRMRLSIIFNLRADAGWVDLVRTQATDAGRSNAGRYIRDLVWLLSSEPEFKAVVIRKLQGVQYGQS